MLSYGLEYLWCSRNQKYCSIALLLPEIVIMDDSTRNRCITEQNNISALSEEQPSTSASSNSAVTESAKRQKLSRKIHIGQCYILL